MINGDNSTNKFFQENTSISTEQPSANLFVQPRKSMLLGYSNHGISSNFAANQNLTQIDSSSNSDIQIPESTTNLANNNPLIENSVKQILGLNQSTTFDTNASSNSNLITNEVSTDGAKLQTGLKEVNISSNDDLQAQLQNPLI